MAVTQRSVSSSLIMILQILVLLHKWDSFLLSTSVSVASPACNSPWISTIFSYFSSLKSSITLFFFDTIGTLLYLCETCGGYRPTKCTKSSGAKAKNYIKTPDQVASTHIYIYIFLPMCLITGWAINKLWVLVSSGPFRSGMESSTQPSNMSSLEQVMRF